jgi:hypothetical protein
MLQCSRLASGEWRVISDVAECACGSLVVHVNELFHVSDRIRVGGICMGMGRVIRVLRIALMGGGVQEEDVGRCGWAVVFSGI